MKTPIYKRKWFLAGVLIIGVGFFTYYLSITTIAKYEAKYPELAQDERERFLSKLNSTDDPSGIIPQRSKEEIEEHSNALMVHGLYGMYRYVGLVFIVLGVICMLLSFKEPQVPTIEDLDDHQSEE